MEIENKLKAMGLELPAAGTPPPGRAGAVRVGNILFVGGHTAGPEQRGKLGADITVEQGYEGAKSAALSCLADVKTVIGDLDKVKLVAKLLCMVNSAPDFGQQPLPTEQPTCSVSYTETPGPTPGLPSAWPPCPTRRASRLR